eukprot:TRINITY_DN1152_c2_g1_i2.p1 TRINITY_DN1152_c2_g1~~TRINITY_DN1152_c2_g1_i2.p1  ORF type:complete len:461 (-),score=93.84 TRINITY_DN1152_c2_g1_i2:97-1479(-)
MIRHLRSWAEFELDPVVDWPAKSSYTIETKPYRQPMSINGKPRDTTPDIETQLLNFSCLINQMVIFTMGWDTEPYDKKTFTGYAYRITDMLNSLSVYIESNKPTFSPQGLLASLAAVSDCRDCVQTLKEAAAKLPITKHGVLEAVGKSVTQMVGASVWLMISFSDKSVVDTSTALSKFTSKIVSGKNYSNLVATLSLVGILSSVVFATRTRSTGMHLTRSWFNLARMSRDAMFEGFDIGENKEVVADLLQDINDYVVFNIPSRIEPTPPGNDEEKIIVSESVKLLRSTLENCASHIPPDSHLVFALEAIKIKLGEIEAIAEACVDDTLFNYENSALPLAVNNFASTVPSLVKFFLSERILDECVQCTMSFTSFLVLSTSCYVLGNSNLPRHHVCTALRSLCYGLTIAADLILYIADQAAHEDHFDNYSSEYSQKDLDEQEKLIQESSENQNDTVAFTDDE